MPEGRSFFHAFAKCEGGRDLSRLPLHRGGLCAKEIVMNRSLINRSPTELIALATQSQIRAIFAITKRQGLDPHKVISERFRVHKMEELTIREASSLIDELKNGAGVRS